jgi:hypothetical protein
VLHKLGQDGCRIQSYVEEGFAQASPQDAACFWLQVDMEWFLSGWAARESRCVERQRLGSEVSHAPLSKYQRNYTLIRLVKPRHLIASLPDPLARTKAAQTHQMGMAGEVPLQSARHLRICTLLLCANVKAPSVKVPPVRLI